MKKPFAPLLLISFILVGLWVVSAGINAGDTKTEVLENIPVEIISADKTSEASAPRQLNPTNSNNSLSPSRANPLIQGEITDPAEADGTQTKASPAVALKPADLQPTANAKVEDPPVVNKPAMPEAPPVISELPAAPQPQPVPVTSETNTMVAEMLGYINAARSEAGLGALILNDTLCRGANQKSRDLGENNYFSHTSPTYGTAFEMMQSLGISYHAAAENIARNRSVKAAFDAFMNSPGHRANILNSNFNKVGIGFWQQGSDLFVTQWFTD